MHILGRQQTCLAAFFVCSQFQILASQAGIDQHLPPNLVATRQGNRCRKIAASRVPHNHQGPVSEEVDRSQSVLVGRRVGMLGT